MSRRLTPTLALCTAAALLLAACASTDGSPAPGAEAKGATYRCDRGERFQVTLGVDAAVLTGPRGRFELLRDAGGLTPAQTVYSNAAMRVEFGLGTAGRDALLQLQKPAEVLRCRLE